MARNFTDVVAQIKKVGPKELVDALEQNVCFWAPEAVWEMLTVYVDKYVIPSSKDEKTIKIYAILCDCSETEMKARFEEAGF